MAHQLRDCFEVPVPRREPDIRLAGRLLNDFQRDFPLRSRPFRHIGECLGASESEIIDRLVELQHAGLVSRVGPVFRPHTLGASTLAAMAVPPAKLNAVANLVSAYPEINHNYERKHRINLWFVVTAKDKPGVRAVIGDIERRFRLEVLTLPMLSDYHIDLGFDLTRSLEARARERGIACPADERQTVSSFKPSPALVEAIQDGLPIVSRPFHAVGARTAMGEDAVIQELDAMIAAGVIKRFGIIVRHHELGYRCNAMVVWDVPDETAGEIGARMSKHPFVTLCYRRARCLPTWPYNLYCMIHGRDRETVQRQIAHLTADCGIGRLAHEILFSGRRFKQRGARYARSGTGRVVPRDGIHF